MRCRAGLLALAFGIALGASAASAAYAAGAGDASLAPSELPPGVVADGAGYRSAKDGMPLVRVPGGAFTMGSDEGRYDERPAHRVYVRGFWLDRHEVTNGQFARFVATSGYAPRGPWLRGAGPGRERRPVRFVTWYDAQAYAEWAGRRLPTEAEWELAARGADGRRYPWGSSWDPARARTNLEVEAGPTDVESFPGGKSPCGAFDLAGNVWEWVRDWYDRYAYAQRAGGPPVRDPTGPPDQAPPEARFRETQTAGGNERSTRKAIRGGGWVRGGRENARAAKRTACDPRRWFNDTGFRCAVGLETTDASDRR